MHVSTSRLLQAALILIASLGVVGCDAEIDVPAAVASQPQTSMALDGQVVGLDLGAQTLVLSRYPAPNVQTVQLTPGTTITRPNGGMGTLQDIQAGVFVQVSGQMGDSGRIIAADVRIISGTVGVPTLESASPAAAEQVLKDFLNSLAADPSGITSVRYLSRRLRLMVESGTPVPVLLKLHKTLPSFSVSAIDANTDPDDASFMVKLNYAPPVERVITLLVEDETWHVDEIEILQP